MHFYKYQRPDRLAFGTLRRGEIYFASVDDLNDASECRPVFIFKGSNELWQRLAHFILSEACLSSDYFRSGGFDMLHKVLDLSDRIGIDLRRSAGNRDLGVEGLGPLFQNALERQIQGQCPEIDRGLLLHLVRSFIHTDFPRALQEDKYIASFSRNATNPTMWGHYAEAERGFVVVYESSDSSLQVRSPIRLLHGSRPSKSHEGVTEIGTYRDEKLELKEVRYGRRPPKVNAFHRLIHKFSYSEMEDHYDVPLLIGGDAATKREDLVGLVKYSDWRYEDEVRAFLPVFDSLLPDARVLQVELDNLCGVIFGPRMSCEDRARVVLCCHLLVESRQQFAEPRKELQFFQARQTLDRFDFEITPVGILDGHYSGKHLPLKPLKSLDQGAAERLHTVAASIAASAHHRRHSKREANRVEVTGLRLSPLPHHPACGSAPGGSSQITEL